MNNPLIDAASSNYSSMEFTFIGFQLAVKSYLCAMILFLNDIGTGEVLLVLAFILIFFGSKSIPGLARTMGRTIRQVKDASQDLQSEIRKSGKEMKGDLDLSGLIQETKDDIKRPLDQYATDIEEAVHRRPIHSQPKVAVVPDEVEEAQEITETKVKKPKVEEPKMVKPKKVKPKVTEPEKVDPPKKEE
ncbi:MAG: sec-independent protein translocase protein TatA [Crocinitomicaceae bacterium]